jgi:uncharacterized protein YndB with AHSA1/START domain
MPARTDLAGTELVIRRILPAPPELVFEVWTVPEHIAHWWGPRGYTAFSCKMDPRPGGGWRVGMRTPEGKEVWARGEFREVVRPSRLVLSFAWEEADGVIDRRETLVTISFTERSGQTEVLLRHGAFEIIEARDLHEQGWSDSLDRFAEYVQHQAEMVRA